jgi:hypothetical protein
MGRACVVHIREMRNAYKIFVEKSEEKRPLGRRRHGLRNSFRDFPRSFNTNAGIILK